MPGKISVEVVYALPERQRLLALTLEQGATAAEAVRLARRQGLLPEAAEHDFALGIWGERVALDRRLEDGDRVEILRPLRIDPREARRELAAEGRVMGTPGRVSSD